MRSVRPADSSPIIELEFNDASCGRTVVWLPEGIATARGFASIYPHSIQWERDGDRIRHSGSVEQAYGEGNFPEVEPGVLECAGVIMVKEPPVEWEVDCRAGEDRLDFTLTVRNPNDVTLSKVAGAVCVKFPGAGWWNDETAYLLTTDGIRSISQIGRAAGMDNGFQAWLMQGEDYPNPFYREFWGFSDTRIARPMWVSVNEQAGCSVVVACDAAYFLHSNPGNPCTDLALKLGHLAPGAEASCSGHVEVTDRGVEEILQD